MIKLTATAFAAIGLIAACATTPSDEPKGAAKFADDARLGEKTDKICFNRNIDNFSDNTRDTVVVRTSPKKQYLLEVRGICSNLNHAQSIAIDSSLSCVTRNDYLIVSTSAFSLNDGGRGPDRCLISGIYKWDKNAETDAEAEPTPAP